MEWQSAASCKCAMVECMVGWMDVEGKKNEGDVELALSYSHSIRYDSWRILYVVWNYAMRERYFAFAALNENSFACLFVVFDVCFAENGSHQP